ncbi:MAG: glucose-1-phosphate adenylyltransferase, partial [Longicatena sp.]
LWEANMDLINPNNELDISDPDWKIYTEDVNAVPQFIGDNAEVNNALITQGCQVYGSVKNSVLFTNTVISQDAKIVDSVIMPNATVGRGAKVTRCIVADDVEIAPGAVVGSKDSENIL